MRNNISEFEKLLEQVEKQIRLDVFAEQAVAVWTSKGNLFCFANHGILSGNMEEENHFMKTLAESGDKEICYLVCMWNDNTLDLPSCHLRDLLIELHPSNKEAGILLNSDEGFQVKLLKTLIP